MTTNVSWNLRVSIKEGQLNDFEELMHEMVASTNEETGTTHYEWFLSADKKVCHLYERYVDSAAAMVHIGNFGANFAHRFMTCVEPANLAVYGEPSSDVRAALDGLGAEYFGTFGGFAR